MTVILLDKTNLVNSLKEQLQALININVLIKKDNDIYDVSSDYVIISNNMYVVYQLEVNDEYTYISYDNLDSIDSGISLWDCYNLEIFKIDSLRSFTLDENVNQVLLDLNILEDDEWTIKSEYFAHANSYIILQLGYDEDEEAYTLFPKLIDDMTYFGCIPDGKIHICQLGEKILGIKEDNDD